MDLPATNPIPFPLANSHDAELVWLPVIDAEESDSPQLALCLKSQGIVLEGFGHELGTHIIGIPPSNNAHEQSKSLVRLRPARLRLIPRHIVASERSRITRTVGYKSSILEFGFSELAVSLSLLDGYVPFIYGVNIAGLKTIIQAVRVTLDGGKVINTRCIFLEQLGVRIELPDYTSIHRVKLDTKHCEVREALELRLRTSTSNEEVYLRPPLDGNGKYPLESLLAVKITFKTGPRAPTDPSREASAIQFVLSALYADIQSSSATNINRHAVLSESTHYIVRPVAMCEDYSRYYIVLEEYSGELLLHAAGPGATLAGDIPRLKKLTRQLALAVFAIHSQGVCNRDISLENIILKPAKALSDLQQAAFDAAESLCALEDGYESQISSNFLSEETCVIVDFEHSQRIQFSEVDRAEGDSSDFERIPIPRLVRNQSIGKSFYLPLENRGKRHLPIDGFACDMWALGICFLIMATGHFPFNPTSEESAFRFYNVLCSNGLDAMKTPHPNNRAAVAGDNMYPLKSLLPEDLLDVIRLLLHPDRRKRITAAQLLLHPWIMDDK